MPGTAVQPKVVSAARFLLQVTGGSQAWGFSELAGIAMEVEPHEFIFCDSTGGIVHTKQYGKSKPPTVTLKKFMDTDTSLWGWHMNAQYGSAAARIDCTLIAYDAGSPGDKPGDDNKIFTWMLESAWPSKIDLAGMKAGATETPIITVTFQCDKISIPLVTPSKTGAIPPSSG